MNCLDEPTLADFDWEAGMRALHSEAGGAYQMLLLAPLDAAALIAAAAVGNTKALAYVPVLETFSRRMTGPRRDAPLCLTCDRLLTGRRRAVFMGLFHALRDDPTQCLAFGLCRVCAAQHGDRNAVADAVLLVLRKGLFPDLRVIPTPVRSAGRA